MLYGNLNFTTAGEEKNVFFEGWYYKVVSADEKHAFAFIPGIAMDADGKQQAFVQVLGLFVIAMIVCVGVVVVCVL